MASLARVRALRPARLLPAHGPIVEDPEALLQRYVHHRRHREGQVLDALRRGLNTPAAMVHQMYPGLSEPLLKLAEEGLLAQLVKLNREGRVRRDGDAWHIMDP
jgi:glyoxylase-like metal-dependent hydrolase (beta-lactamase superfamily II)